MGILMPGFWLSNGSFFLLLMSGVCKSAGQSLLTNHPPEVFTLPEWRCVLKWRTHDKVEI
ncbi:hypothetical protein C4D60_Mb10t11000 [Musa balbisiana]|uniref:Uncharacterized protein n=1 Tax=Musa balbisiana TaxID=52838 RepID=A0A4S8IWB6_MUSBA|nr:hypothetical protein C4D60_Mb10t11000 [Musa balbisiana]